MKQFYTLDSTETVRVELDAEACYRPPDIRQLLIDAGASEANAHWFTIKSEEKVNA